ncbi:hypothetical protein Taro_025202, partial [Colocasia esculenta]|nr:hypothetical protein [Colocasia esculenta]
ASTQADHNSEVERQVHLSEEVLEAYYEELNGSEPNSASSTMASQTILRKTRGSTQESTVTPQKGEKWKCLLIDRQPVGKAASKLAIVLGLYARLDGYFLPYKEWKEQSPHSFNDVMKDIMRDYDFVDDEGLPANVNIVTHFCKESLQRKLRDWRCWLKAHYYIEGIPEEVLMKSPDKRREKLGGNYTTFGAYLKAHQTKSGGYPDEYTHAMCVSKCYEIVRTFESNFH